MPSSKCFYTHEMLYRGFKATFKLNSSSVGSPWRAEQRTVIQGDNFGYILIQPLKDGVILDTLLQVFQARVMSIVDEHCYSKTS
ncbi:hypothetical protein [Pseudomonas sp. NyZ201]|uniref:hypothetical protein n=1 Tax=Pseudomonas sp. NyZ201 TaxID=3409857 RepID=UPI003CEDE743